MNKWLYEKVRKSGKETENFILHYIKEIDNIQERKAATIRSVITWTPHPVGAVKINFDSSFDRTQLKSASGIVAQMSLE